MERARGRWAQAVLGVLQQAMRGRAAVPVERAVVVGEAMAVAATVAEVTLAKQLAWC